MQTEIASLRRQVRRLQLCTGGLAALMLLTFVAGFARARPAGEDQVIRARGIVIVDSAGRERILIGAPIPAAHNRVRTNTARVRQIWGPRFPKEYETYYKTYRNSMNGILVLDEHGFDRVALGDSVPDPNIGRRIGPATGLVINDSQGFERTGYSLLHVNGRDRVVLGLDNNQGGEGVVLSVQDSGAVGLSVDAGDASMWLGRVPQAIPGLTTKAFSGLLLKDGSSKKVISASEDP